MEARFAKTSCSQCGQEFGPGNSGFSECGEHAPSNRKETGGPAFPVADYDHQTFSPATVDEARRLLSGMCLRDYFAAKAIPAVVADFYESGLNPGHANNAELLAKYATAAYVIADAMLAARQS